MIWVFSQDVLTALVRAKRYGTEQQRNAAKTIHSKFVFLDGMHHETVVFDAELAPYWDLIKDIEEVNHAEYQ